ncbi:hypothetical protein V7S76_03805 [Aquirufa sp. ROCK2-A2]
MEKSPKQLSEVPVKESWEKPELEMVSVKKKTLFNPGGVSTDGFFYS